MVLARMGRDEWSEKRKWTGKGTHSESIQQQGMAVASLVSKPTGRKKKLWGERGSGVQVWTTTPMPGNTGMYAAQIVVIWAEGWKIQ